MLTLPGVLASWELFPLDEIIYILSERVDFLVFDFFDHEGIFSFGAYSLHLNLMETKDNTTFRVRSLLERMKHIAEQSSPLPAAESHLIEEASSFRDSWKNQKTVIVQ